MARAWWGALSSACGLWVLCTLGPILTEGTCVSGASDGMRVLSIFAWASDTSHEHLTRTRLTAENCLKGGKQLHAMQCGWAGL